MKPPIREPIERRHPVEKELFTGMLNALGIMLIATVVGYVVFYKLNPFRVSADNAVAEWAEKVTR